MLICWCWSADADLLMLTWCWLMLMPMLMLFDADADMMSRWMQWLFRNYAIRAEEPHTWRLFFTKKQKDFVSAKEQGLRTNAAASVHLWHLLVLPLLHLLLLDVEVLLLLPLLLLVDVETILLLIVGYSPTTSLRVIGRKTQLSISVPVSVTT